MLTKSVIAILLLALVSNSQGQESLFKFATSRHYRNLKLVSESRNAIIAIRMQPATKSQSSARLACFKECFVNPHCRAINFHSTDEFHMCELLADSLCSTTGRLSLVGSRGSSVWDKVDHGSTQACIDQHFNFLPENEWCEAVRPGCAGVWPECNECVETCVDCEKRYKNSGLADRYNCTLWPGGRTSKPIFASCIGSGTVIMSRTFDPKFDATPTNYLMSFVDMNRLTDLPVYNYMVFTFSTDSMTDSFFEFVTDPYIHANGTLSRKTKLPPMLHENIVAIDGGVRHKPFVFVHSNTDMESCGSFWHFDPRNPANCPGGALGLFGPVKRDAFGRVTSTGIRHGTVTKDLLTSGFVTLERIHIDEHGRAKMAENWPPADEFHIE